MPWQAMPDMVAGEDGEFRLPERPDRMPLTYTLQAVKPVTAAAGGCPALPSTRHGCDCTWLLDFVAAPAAGRGRETRFGGPPRRTRLSHMSSRVLTAVAWPYANGPRHIGHVSGFGVPSDVFSRYMRMSGHDVLMVSGTDEHGTPILVQAEREGLTTRETRRQVQPGDRRGPAGSRAVVRPVHPHHHPQPLRGGAGRVQGSVRQRLHRGQADHGGGLAVDRPDAARPLHRGHLPDLRLRRRPRRPVRQLRQPARPDRPDQPALPDQRRDAEVRRDRALLPRPAGAGRVAGQLAVRRAPTGAPTC